MAACKSLFFANSKTVVISFLHFVKLLCEFTLFYVSRFFYLGQIVLRGSELLCRLKVLRW